MFSLAAPAFLALMLWGMFGLPPAGEYSGVYGRVLNAVAVNERHATDVVTAINFDYRGFDTLGEEFILFASVLGGTLLLRKTRDETDQPRRDSRTLEPGDRGPRNPGPAVRAAALSLVGVTVLFGLYVASHGQLSPGGGFQGGVVLATAPLLVYLAGSAGMFERVVPLALVEFTESAGATGFALVGFFGLVRGGAFLQNVLPLGSTGELLSAGTIPLISVLTGLEVGAGFALLLRTFVEETEPRGEGES